MDTEEVIWEVRAFHALTVSSLYEVLTLRNLVFVVEQQCIYLDTDGKDPLALHLTGVNRDGEVVAYCRLFAPGIVYKEASIGRVVTHPKFRRAGLGKELMREAIKSLESHFGKVPVRISAQLYLKNFYEEQGFVAFGEIYLEDDIDHIAMLRPCN